MFARRILVPTDFSSIAYRAFEYALWLIDAVGAAGVSVLHVHPRADVFHPTDSAMGKIDALDRSIHASASAQLDRFVTELEPAVRTRVAPHLAAGGAAETIVDQASRLGCDLIVMGTHGRTGARHFLLGSVAERVIRRAPCPVITIR